VFLGAVLVCAVTLAAVGDVRQQPGIDTAATRAPTQVEVTNFPAVQAIPGQVQVGSQPGGEGHTS